MAIPNFLLTPWMDKARLSPQNSPCFTFLSTVVFKVFTDKSQNCPKSVGGTMVMSTQI